MIYYVHDSYRLYQYPWAAAGCLATLGGQPFVHQVHHCDSLSDSLSQVIVIVDRDVFLYHK